MLLFAHSDILRSNHRNAENNVQTPTEHVAVNDSVEARQGGGTQSPPRNIADFSSTSSGERYSKLFLFSFSNCCIPVMIFFTKHRT